MSGNPNQIISHALDAISISMEIEIDQYLSEEARQKYARLTPSAKLLLMLPLADSFEFAQRFKGRLSDLDREVRNQLFPSAKRFATSLESILDAAFEDPSLMDRVRNEESRSTTSIFKAIHKKFCQIPPFCGD